MSNKITVDSSVLFFAFRYSLGRKSYAPQIVIDNIKGNIDDIKTEEISSYIKEISECEDYGMDMDEDEWFAFKEYLEREFNKRKKDKK